MLTGGSSPRRAYELAAALEPDWGGVSLWWGDERCVPPDNELSNYRLAAESLLAGIESAPAEIHRIRGELPPTQAASELDAALDGVDLDLMLLGLGPDGHLASLFPGSPQLKVEDRRATSGPAGLEPWVDRVTMTLPTIRAARQIVFLVSGAEKADAVARAFAGPADRRGARQPGAPGTNARPGLPRCRRIVQTVPVTQPEHHTEPLDVLELDRPEQLKALGHPLRLKVLQVLGEAGLPLTNRELAARLNVDPGHLHFHVRMLNRAGLIERAEAAGREKPYRPVAKHLRVGPEIRATGLASDLQGAQLRELQRGFDLHAANGEFRSAQVHAKVDVETLRKLFRELLDQINEVEDESEALQTITVAFHPAFEQGDAD